MWIIYCYCELLIILGTKWSPYQCIPVLGNGDTLINTNNKITSDIIRGVSELNLAGFKVNNTSPTVIAGPDVYS